MQIFIYNICIKYDFFYKGIIRHGAGSAEKSQQCITVIYNEWLLSTLNINQFEANSLIKVYRLNNFLKIKCLSIICNILALTYA